MNSATYTIIDYLNHKTTLKAKIQAIEDLTAKMFEASLEGALGLNSGIQEYSMDDGQIKVKTVYRSVDQILASIKTLEALKQMYLNQLNGRVTNLINAKVFARW